MNDSKAGEPVAVIGSDFQLLWCRVDWSKGLKVGDMLYTAAPSMQAEQAPCDIPAGWQHVAAITPAQAIAALRHAMQKDAGYAWTWHCNVAMVAIDAGAPHKEANERAADFMRRAFDVDTTQRP